tara:strand:- start:250 stop:408 length:159 start_codon:yes stop_codon:yes gene_type:complete
MKENGPLKDVQNPVVCQTLSLIMTFFKDYVDYKHEAQASEFHLAETSEHNRP